MTSEGYRYQLELHKRNLQVYYSEHVEDMPPIYNWYKSLFEMVCAVLDDWESDVRALEEDIDEAESVIASQEEYITFYQDMLKKTNDALCDMINIVRDSKPLEEKEQKNDTLGQP